MVRPEPFRGLPGVLLVPAVEGWQGAEAEGDGGLALGIGFDAAVDVRELPVEWLQPRPGVDAPNL
jgi:hypothetical protein